MKKVKLDDLPKHSHLPKTMNVKLIISSRNENELRCKIMEVTDIMYILQHACSLQNYIMERLRKVQINVCWQPQLI